MALDNPESKVYVLIGTPALFKQIVPPFNVGFGNGLTTIVIVCVVAQTPAVGVKVYVVVAILFIPGDQVPVIPLVEVVGKAAKAYPEQIGPTAAKVGTVFGVTVTVIVCVVAHCPADGLKVYVVVVVLLNTGDQTPVMPLVDVVGNVVTVPEQIGPTGAKAGVIIGFTVMVIVVVVAQSPAVGVKV